MLIELGAFTPLSRLVQRVKANTAHMANQAEHRSGKVWMPGFHDHALRCEESIAAVARYMIVNPVRAGLVRRAGDYPYWNCAWLEEGMADWGGM